ncbi:MAG: phage holin family protein [Variibacter sp.]|nr:phage holin family protein [Variibacter sp.]
MTMAQEYKRSVPEIVSDILRQVTNLFQKEMQLARTEVSEKMNQAFAGFVMVLIGAVLLMPAIVVLLQAAVAALVSEGGLAEHWAALIVGGAALVVGIIIALIGMSRLKARNLTPTRTMTQLQRDAAVAKEQVG